MSDPEAMPPSPTAEDLAAEQEARDKAAAEVLAAALAEMAAANANAKPIDLPELDIVEAPRGSFGPTFRAELGVAGVAALQFVVHPDRVIFSAGISPEDRAAVLAVMKAHDPAALPVDPVPASVLDYQFAGQACAENIIDFEAAKAWTGSGVVPKVLLDAVDALVADHDRHDRVVLFLMGTKEFPRNHELTPILAATFGKDTPEKLDAFFVAAGKR